MSEPLKQGLEQYKEEFRTYTKWLKPKVTDLAKATGGKVTGTVLFKKMDISDWRENCEQMRNLESLEKELALSDAVIEQIAKEVGYLDIDWG